jgi:hypothetical protein
MRTTPTLSFLAKCPISRRAVSTKATRAQSVVNVCYHPVNGRSWPCSESTMFSDAPNARLFFGWGVGIARKRLDRPYRFNLMGLSDSLH